MTEGVRHIKLLLPPRNSQQLPRLSGQYIPDFAIHSQRSRPRADPHRIALGSLAHETYPTPAREPLALDPRKYKPHQLGSRKRPAIGQKCPLDGPLISAAVGCQLGAEKATIERPDCASELVSGINPMEKQRWPMKLQ
jgi:hypothetical protein